MSFIETRLLDEVALGFSGGPTWYTLTTQLRSGIVRRKKMRTRPIHKFRGSFDNRSLDILSELLNAFNATAGASYGFRFKNWLDYELVNQPLGTGTGSSQVIQLFKTYSFGPTTVDIPIKKPNNDITVTADGVPVGVIVDTTTGIIEFTAPVDSELLCSGTFDIPVYFESDEFAAQIVEYRTATIDVSLVEDLSA